MKKFIVPIYILSIALFFSCHDSTGLGYDLLPAGDLVNPEIIDTFSLEVYTLPEDTISANSSSTFMLGEYIDPVFGYSKASFVSQFWSDTYPFFGEFWIGDSIVLKLDFKMLADTSDIEYYGNIDRPLMIKVYRIPSDLDMDTTFFSNQDPSVFMSGDLIGSYLYTHNPLQDTLSIPLDVDLAQELIDTDKNTYSTMTSFLNIFKGLYVTIDGYNITPNGYDNDHAIVKFKVTSNSKIRLYTHYDDGNTVGDPLTYDISCNTTGLKRFNLFEHDYTGTTFYNQIGNETLPQDSVAYIQTMGGLRTKIKIPYLKNLKDLGNIEIYRAELVIKTAPYYLTYESQYQPIQKLLLAGCSSDNEYYLLPEYLYGLTYNGVTIKNNEYRFEMAGYIRDILDEQAENDGLYLFPYTGSENFGRTVITTGNHSDQIKLIVTYVKL